MSDNYKVSKEAFDTCDAFDASVFSSDMFLGESDALYLSKMLERWKRFNDGTIASLITEKQYQQAVLSQDGTAPSTLSHSVENPPKA